MFTSGGPYSIASRASGGRLMAVDEIALVLRCALVRSTLANEKSKVSSLLNKRTTRRQSCRPVCLQLGSNALVCVARSMLSKAQSGFVSNVQLRALVLPTPTVWIPRVRSYGACVRCVQACAHNTWLVMTVAPHPL